MSKKLFIGILLSGVIVTASLGIYYWQVFSKKSSAQSPLSETPLVSEKEEVAVWEDQAGFSFSYPKKLASDIHEEDQENYAHIEFTHPDHPGSITVWAKDTTVTDAATWVKQEKGLNGGTVFDTEFAGQSGIKILISTPKKKIITATVDDAIVFYVEGEFDQSEYWTATYETIVSSFSFISDADPATSYSSEGSQMTQEEMSVDEEEILE